MHGAADAPLRRCGPLALCFALARHVMRRTPKSSNTGSSVSGLGTSAWLVVWAKSQLTFLACRCRASTRHAALRRLLLLSAQRESLRFPQMAAVFVSCRRFPARVQ